MKSLNLRLRTIEEESCGKTVRAAAFWDIPSPRNAVEATLSSSPWLLKQVLNEDDTNRQANTEGGNLMGAQP